jgi:hypothetical protein
MSEVCGRWAQVTTWRGESLKMVCKQQPGHAVPPAACCYPAYVALQIANEIGGEVHFGPGEWNMQAGGRVTEPGDAIQAEPWQEPPHWTWHGHPVPSSEPIRNDGTGCPCRFESRGVSEDGNRQVLLRIDPACPHHGDLPTALGGLSPEHTAPEPSPSAAPPAPGE